MRQLSLLISILAISWCPVATFAQTNFPDIDSFVKSLLKDQDRLSLKARGDLNSDGLEDWAGVIHRQTSDSAPTYQLYVLLRIRDGGYRVAEKSQQAEIPGMGCCWLEDLQIRRGSIYIQNNAKDASTMEAATHQFKLHRGKWRLVGLTIYLTDHSPEALMTRDTEMNLLTGAVVEKKQKGDSKPVTQRRHKKFATYLLKDFDFSNSLGIE
jgi:hypothetical protein